jgi:fibronectin type 3 domain-containing protein
MWDANPEPDIAGYKLYWGQTSRQYEQSVDVGRATTGTASPLNAGTTYYFAVTAHNTAGLESDPSNEVTVTVPSANQPPAVNAGADQTISLPASATLNGAATDDALPNPPAKLTTTWSQVSGPGTVTFGNASALSTSASFSTAGTYVLKLTANDGSLSTSSQMTVTVNPPEFAGYSLKTAANTSATVASAKILSGARDPDTDQLSITSVTSPRTQGGTVVLNTDSVTYTPPSGFTGTDSFTVTISDGRGGTVNGTVTVTVTVPTSSGSGPNLAKITPGPGNGITLTFYGVPMKSYDIQRTVNLSTWTTIATVTATPSGKLEYTDATVLSGAFYRTATTP